MSPSSHTTAGVPIGELIMHSKWRSNISLIIALEMEMILYIIQPLVPDRCPNKKFNWIVYRKFYKSIEDVFKQVEFEFEVKRGLEKVLNLERNKEKRCEI